MSGSLRSVSLRRPLEVKERLSVMTNCELQLRKKGSSIRQHHIQINIPPTKRSEDEENPPNIFSQDRDHGLESRAHRASIMRSFDRSTASTRRTSEQQNGDQQIPRQILQERTLTKTSMVTF